MKAIFYFILFILMLSCNKNSQETLPENLIGTWKAKEITLSGKAKIGGFPIPFKHTKDNDCTKASFLQLDENQKGTISLSDDTLGNCEKFQDQDFEYDYDPMNKRFTIMAGGREETLDVLFENKDELTLQKKVTDYSLNGVLFSGEIIIVFVK